MGTWSNFMTALRAGATAFRESYLDAELLDFELGDWAEPEARRLRYSLQWAYFQGNAYRSIHRWSKKMKADYGLYRYTRDIYNPAFRLGSFYRSNIWGGRLDMKAGDGQERPSALPIIADNAKIVEPLATLWRDSNWKSKRKIAPLHGSVMGDTFITIVDDVAREKVYLDIIHPGTVSQLDKDPYGNVKSYTIEEGRKDESGKSVTYREVVTRDGDNVVYELFKDNAPYHWGHTDEMGNPVDAWVVPYGFVPMVHIQHFDFGSDWGMSELMPKLAMFREVDDGGSKLGDQIRKTVDAAMMMSGVRQGDIGVSSPSDDSMGGRDDVPIIYAPVGSDVKFLVAPLDIEAVTNKIRGDLEELEKDYPELALLRALNAGSDLSGVALERLQAQATQKIQDYRDNYDDGLVRAQQMAVAIGGWRNYNGYNDFDLDSYAKGDLNHEIGERPVFVATPSHLAELAKSQTEGQRNAVQAGWPLVEYLRYRQVDEDVIEEIMASPEYKARLAGLEMTTFMNGDEDG